MLKVMPAHSSVRTLVETKLQNELADTIVADIKRLVQQDTTEKKNDTPKQGSSKQRKGIR